MFGSHGRKQRFATYELYERRAAKGPDEKGNRRNFGAHDKIGTNTVDVILDEESLTALGRREVSDGLPEARTRR